MSQLSVLNEVILKLEEAELTLLHARRAFPDLSKEYHVIDSQYEAVGDAVEIIKNILAGVEKRLVTISPQQPSQHSTGGTNVS